MDDRAYELPELAMVYDETGTGDGVRVWRFSNGRTVVHGLYEHQNEQGATVKVEIKATISGDGAGEGFLHRFAEDTRQVYFALGELLGHSENGATITEELRERIERAVSISEDRLKEADGKDPFRHESAARCNSIWKIVQRRFRDLTANEMTEAKEEAIYAANIYMKLTEKDTHVSELKHTGRAVYCLIRAADGERQINGTPADAEELLSE